MRKAVKIALSAVLVLACATAYYFATAQDRAQREVEAGYKHFAQRDFSAVGLTHLPSLHCELFDGVFNQTGKTLYRCTIDTVCGTPIEQMVWYSPLQGAFMVPDPFAQIFARYCGEMLSEEALTKVSAGMDKGG